MCCTSTMSEMILLHVDGFSFLYATLIERYYVFVSEEFEFVLKQTEVHNAIPFDFNTDFTRLYFGKNRQRRVTYAEFTQLLFVRH